MHEKVRVGVIGCGTISGVYLTAAKGFGIMEVVACADMNMEAAQKTADEYGIEAMTVDALLADSEIEIVVNLTTPQAHTEVNLKALAAGKHVHCEKPLALNRVDGKKVIDRGREKGLLVGCAPDTFLGGGIQTCRKLIDDGCIGRCVAGTAFMMGHGMESWHPNPGFYYKKGGGPLFDMGPYYITALVNLMGPVKRVSEMSARTFKERIATSKGMEGTVLPVEVATHIAGTLEFCGGAIVALVMSYDVWRHTNHCIEIHGETGSVQVPDPNQFHGPVRMFKPGQEDWEAAPLSHGYIEQMRSIGVADMAYAIRSGRKQRCSGDLAYHVLDVMESIEDSAAKGEAVTIESTTEKPAALPVGLAEGELDD